MPDNSQTILVEILQGSPINTGGCNCSGGCPSASNCGGNNDNYQELTAEMAEDLKKTYGDKVEVKYVDFDKEGLANYPIMSRVQQMGYPYPVTLINGEPKFAGGIM
ncbi:MAG: hypothetical protein WAX04_07515, partial [Oscillospiraceae bacterium]